MIFSHIRKRPLIILGLTIIFSIALSFVFIPTGNGAEMKAKFWNFQAIDTMKYSRDLAREKRNDPTYDVAIEQQIKKIADTGATHVAIATPYDAEFIPFLKRWVKYARQYELNVWFRGNFAGWEQWFEYDRIDRKAHLQLTEQFILSNPDLFEDGDVFTGCPECENGGPGDPRHNGDASGHKAFLIDEYEVSKRAFRTIGKNVASNYNSMNGDVARLIMDRETTKKLGGLVVVDHYVKSPETLNEDISEYARLSGGKVVLGEYGAPIPDIHGEFSEIEQAEWLSETMSLLSKNENLVGLSYWTNMGGSTQLWEQSGAKRAAVDIITKAYNPFTLQGRVVNVYNVKINNVTIKFDGISMQLGKDGSIVLPSLVSQKEIAIEAKGYATQSVTLSENSGKIVLVKSSPGLVEKILQILSSIRLPLHS